jgi:hypothetical protein
VETYLAFCSRFDFIFSEKIKKGKTSGRQSLVIRGVIVYSKYMHPIFRRVLVTVKIYATSSSQVIKKYFLLFENYIAVSFLKK